MSSKWAAVLICLAVVLSVGLAVLWLDAREESREYNRRLERLRERP